MEGFQGRKFFAREPTGFPARRRRRRAGKPVDSRAKNFLPLNPSIFCPLAGNFYFSNFYGRIK